MLQIKLEWTDNSVSLSQNRQIESLKKKFNVCDSKRVFTTPLETKLQLTKGDANNLPDIPYRELVCSLLFIARYTRPEIQFAVTLLCRFLTNYTKGIGRQPNGFYATQQVQQTEYFSTLEI
jgi:hypothetical protein